MRRAKIYFQTLNEAEAADAAITATLLFNDGITVRWCAPMQDMDAYGHPVDSRWFILATDAQTELLDTAGILYSE